MFRQISISSILGFYYVRAWIGSIWLRGCCVYSKESSVSVKGGEFTEQLSNYQPFK
jgi:hypothetical protein